MIQCVERRVHIFQSKDVIPSEEDGYRGYVLAMTEDGFWIGVPVAAVQATPPRFPEWMQYPDLAKHENRFS